MKDTSAARDLSLVYAPPQASSLTSAGLTQAVLA